MNRIIIIGTQPPCPRCRLMTKVMAAKVLESGLKAEVRHISYTDREAKDWAATLGLEPGTAKDVAKRLNRTIDMETIDRIIAEGPNNTDYEYGEYNNCGWSRKLDDFLRPFEKKARDTGILMTPVLIINGRIMHQGSLPPLYKLEAWLSEIIPVRSGIPS